MSIGRSDSLPASLVYITRDDLVQANHYLDRLKVPELREAARCIHISRTSSMKKQEVKDAILQIIQQYTQQKDFHRLALVLIIIASVATRGPGKFPFLETQYGILMSRPNPHTGFNELLREFGYGFPSNGNQPQPPLIAHRPPPNSSFYTGPGISFTPNPFYDIVQKLTIDPQFGAGGPKKRDIVLRFNVSQTLAELVKLKDYRVCIFVGRPPPPFTPGDKKGYIEYPSRFEVRINDHKLDASLGRGRKNDITSNKPFDLTGYLSPTGQNTVVLSFIDDNNFIMYASLVRFKSVETVMAENTFDHITEEEELNNVRKYFQNEDEISISNIKISLVDTVTLARIKTAVKSKKCEHFQCFDLTMFLQLQQQSYYWACPVCSVKFDIKDLVISDLFDRLAKTSTSDSILIEEDGTIKEIDEDETTNNAPTHTPKPVKTITPVAEEIIILSDSEEDQEDQSMTEPVNEIKEDGPSDNLDGPKEEEPVTCLTDFQNTRSIPAHVISSQPQQAYQPQDIQMRGPFQNPDRRSPPPPPPPGQPPARHPTPKQNSPLNGTQYVSQPATDARHSISVTQPTETRNPIQITQSTTEPRSPSQITQKTTETRNQVPITQPTTETRNWIQITQSPTESTNPTPVTQPTSEPRNQESVRPPAPPSRSPQIRNLISQLQDPSGLTTTPPHSQYPYSFQALRQMRDEESISNHNSNSNGQHTQTTTESPSTILLQTVGDLRLLSTPRKTSEQTKASDGDTHPSTALMDLIRRIREAKQLVEAQKEVERESQKQVQEPVTQNLEPQNVHNSVPQRSVSPSPVIPNPTPQSNGTRLNQGTSNNQATTNQTQNPTLPTQNAVRPPLLSHNLTPVPSVQLTLAPLLRDLLAPPMPRLSSHSLSSQNLMNSTVESEPQVSNPRDTMRRSQSSDSNLVHPDRERLIVGFPFSDSFDNSNSQPVNPYPTGTNGSQPVNSYPTGSNKNPPLTQSKRLSSLSPPVTNDKFTEKHLRDMAPSQRNRRPVEIADIITISSDSDDEFDDEIPLSRMNRTATINKRKKVPEINDEPPVNTPPQIHSPKRVHKNPENQRPNLLGINPAGMSLDL